MIDAQLPNLGKPHVSINPKGVAPQGGALIILIDIDNQPEWPLLWHYLSDHNLTPWEKTFVKEKLAKDQWAYVPRSPTPLAIRRVSKSPSIEQRGAFCESAYTRYRNLGGQILLACDALGVTKAHIHGINLDQSALAGITCGLGLAEYKFKNQSGESKYQWQFDIESEAWQKGYLRAQSVNLARHLVNLPAGSLYPNRMQELIGELFAPSPSISMTVYDFAALKREGMNLIVAVGQGAFHKPCLVKLAYRGRPADDAVDVAIIGKGITFDTGGLDMKESANMRLMKKDMAGAASAIGTAYWLSEAKLPVNVDIWLPLAENSVSGESVRPGDVMRSKKGLTIEMHNTDAEGRLVMADAMAMAQLPQVKRNHPLILIDLATLTGAARVALGTKVAALFSNDERLSQDMEAAANHAGDYIWRLPLVKDYEEQLNSTVADMTNASSSSFGGAITAALFLNRFIEEGTLWAHIDMMAWEFSQSSAITEVGGNGQGTQLLIEYLTRYSQRIGA